MATISQFGVYNLGPGNILANVTQESIVRDTVQSINATSVYNVAGIKTKIVTDWGGVLKTNYVNELVADCITKLS